MRALTVFRKALREQLRELWLLALLLSLAPFFVVLFALVFGSGGWSYRVVVVNHDKGAVRADGKPLRAGDDLIAAITEVKSATGTKALRVSSAVSRKDAQKLLETGKAHALIEIPDGFSRALAAPPPADGPRPKLVYMGDLTSTNYMVAAVLAITAVSTYIEQATGRRSPVDLAEEALGGSGARSELDMALPGLFVFAIMLLIFPVAMALARENESGTLRRLQLSRLTSFDLLAGLSLVQVLIGAAAVLLAYTAALAMGFKSQGPLWAGVLVCVIAAFAVIGVGLLVACFSRSVTEAFILGNFPLMLLMFFSGAMLPIPKVPLFTLGAVTVGLWDWIPTTHAVSAMNKILGIGLGPGDCLYELISLVALSALYFAVGVWLFKRRRLSAA